MRSVAVKMVAGFTLVAVVSVLVVAFLADRYTAQEFGNYLESGAIGHQQSVVDYLAGRYTSTGGWRGLPPVLASLSGWLGQRLIVADASGKVVGDSAGQLAVGANLPKPAPSDAFPIVAGGKTVGTLYLTSDTPARWGMMGGMMGGFGPSGAPATMADMMRYMTQQAGTPERGFLDAVNRALWASAGIAAVLALLLGLVISRQITAPLQRITAAARRVASGDFEQRVEVKSRDELETMAQAFNSMAASLARNEQQRKQLLGDIAHELKTPLAVVQGNLEAMIDGVVETTPERLASLRDETVLLTRLVTDLRDLSLAEAGHLPLHLERVVVGDLVKGAVAGVEAHARERQVGVETEVPESLPAVVADRDRVGQVLHNLLGNALRYTPAGGSVRLSAALFGDFSLVHDRSVSSRPTVNPQHSALTPQDSVLSPQSSVLITVSDTGSGIPAEELPKVFDRFYRVDKSRTRSSGGTGLGLSVAKQLVEAQGGRIWAESEPGKGAAFHFTLPCAPSPHGRGSG